MRHCKGCEDDFLDVPDNWTRVSKFNNTGLCRLCTNENYKRLYKDKVDCNDYPDRYRTCSKCKKELLDLNDNWKRRALVKMTGTCVTCNHDWSKKHYEANKSYHRKKSREYRSNNPDYFKVYMSKYKRVKE